MKIVSDLKLMRAARIYRLASGKWKHARSNYEFDEYLGAAMDYRFCGEWDRNSFKGERDEDRL